MNSREKRLVELVHDRFYLEHKWANLFNWLETNERIYNNPILRDFLLFAFVVIVTVLATILMTFVSTWR